MSVKTASAAAGKCPSLSTTSAKVFKLLDENEELLDITIHEEYDADAAYSLQIWPAAPVLAQYIWHYRDYFRGRIVLELGCGTALPGIVAAKAGAQVILTDAFPHSSSKKLCEKNATDNGLIFAQISVATLTWGVFDKSFFNLPELDIIIASDCFYDTKDFNDVLATVSLLLREKCKPGSCFITTYQLRHSDWNIGCQLEHWGLKCSYIPLDSCGADGPELLGSRYPGSSTIFLMKFELNQ